MSDWSAKNPYDGGSYVETCSYCGCVYKVDIQLQDGHNESEEYHCPDCRKENSTRACNSPRVSKISDRTDGKSDFYPNN